MAVAFRSAITATADNATSQTVNKPTGTVAGDLLLAIIWQDSDGAASLASITATGWTQVGGNITASGVSPGGKIFSRFAGAEANYTFGLAADSSAITILALTGADSTAPIRLNPVFAAGTASPMTTGTAFASGAGQQAGDLVVATFSRQGGSCTYTLTGTTERGDATTTWVSAGTGSQAVSGTTALGPFTATGTGSLNGNWRTATLVVSQVTAINLSGSATAAMALSATRTGAKNASGTRTAALTLGASSTGHKGGIGSRTAAMTLSASRTGTKTTSGSATAAMALSASEVGNRINLGLAVMTLSASLSGTVHTGSATRTAPMMLGASTAAVHTSSTSRTAAMTLSATRVGAKSQPGARTAAMSLAATITALKQATGVRAAPMVLTASTAALKQAVGLRTAAMTLAATLAGNVRANGSARTAPMALTATTSASRANGSSRTAVMLLTATATGIRIVVEVQGGALTARAQITVPYELVCVARIPQTSGPPSLIEVDPIDWTGLSYVDELSKPQQLNAGAKISNLTEPVLQRLRNLAELATELWLYRNGKLVFAGPLLGWQIQGESLTFQAQGLLAYLKMMVVTTDEVFSQVDQFTIATTLIDQWQSLDYGNFGIDTTGAGASGVLRDATYLQKELHPVGQRVEELGARENGFDVSIDPATRKLQLAYPLQGLDRSVGEDAIVFDARNVTSPNIVCSAAPGDVASEAFGTGTGDSTVYSVESNLVRRAQYGRTAVAATFDGISEQATLDAHVQGMLDVRDEALLIPGPDVRVTTDSDLSSYDVGDTVSYQLHSQLAVGGAFRLRKRSVTVSNTGQESVSVAFA